MKIESSIRELKGSQQAAYNLLSDLSNVEKLLSQLPEDKVGDLQVDQNSLAISTPMGKVRMEVVEREEPKMVKMTSTDSPVPFTFWIQLLPVTDHVAKMKLTLQAELNPFMASMVKKQAQEAVEKVADALQTIHYE